MTVFNIYLDFFVISYPAHGPDLAEPSGKRQYGREFLLGFQFMSACTQKPEGLPPISDVVLDKVRSLYWFRLKDSIHFKPSDSQFVQR